jgi:hypothetical protein
MDEWIDDTWDVDQRVFDEDADEFEIPLTRAHALRPPRNAWRFDCAAAPNRRAVYAREPNAMRVLIAQREDEDWFLITRDGEVQPLDDVASWAPLISALV